MGVFELNNARKYRLVSGVASQAAIPLHTIGRKLWVSIPRMGVFELHNARKYCVGSDVASQPPRALHTMDEKMFLDPYDGCL